MQANKRSKHVSI